MERKVNDKISQFSMKSFELQRPDMVAKGKHSYENGTWDLMRGMPIKEYSLEEVRKILDSDNIEDKIRLSNNYFERDGFYRRIIIHYATLFKYAAMLIPTPNNGKTLSDDFVIKKYNNALNFIDRANLPSFFENCAFMTLVNGIYYGVIQKQDKNTFAILDLPIDYCRTRFKDFKGNDILEFNVKYFDSIRDKKSRKIALKAYPTKITNYYNSYINGKTKEDPWLFIEIEDGGICFQLYDGVPGFLEVIPATINYDLAVETEQERSLNEIKKIIIQKIPHLQDGTLLFETPEGAEIHKATSDMMAHDTNTSVLTTYADVEVASTKTTDSNAVNNLDKMANYVYSEGGVSKLLFATDGSSSLEISIKNDVAFMTPLIHKFEIFITNLINERFGNTNINFNYKILPITPYNEDDYASNALQLANSGYSFLVPALAMGFSQSELSNIKDLENNILDLKSKLIPLQTSFTQSSNNVGRPELDESQKSQKTIQNEKSIDAGGSV